MAFNCPNCSVLIEVRFIQLLDSEKRYSSPLNFGYTVSFKNNSSNHTWRIYLSKCLSCDIPLIQVEDSCRSLIGVDESDNNVYKDTYKEYLIYPNKLNINLPIEVPEKYRTYFKEACSVLNYSPTASAALSRRLLQLLLVEKAGVKENINLYNMIDSVIKSGNLPSYLSDGIDSIREIGNYAAHPNKYTNSNEIIDVEPGEAEWSLNILEGL